MRGVAPAVEALVRLLRAEFWVVSVFPAWVGWVVATGQAFPAQGEIIETLRHSPLDFDAVGYARDHVRVGLAILTLGPFLGGALMVTNDYFDRRVDVFNPKKTRSPLVAGTATPERAAALMVLLSLATLVTAFSLDATFGWLMAVGLLLSFLYSAPPVRLKARPLGDIAINALGYGVLATWAGWVLGGGEGVVPAGPLFIVATGIVAGYVPTVMMDATPDSQAGLRTTAVALGLRASWILGFEALLAANAAIAGLSLMGRYVGPGFLAWQAPFFLLELLGYVYYVRSREPKDMFVGGGLAVAGLFGNLGAFLAVFTGLPV